MIDQDLDDSYILLNTFPKEAFLTTETLKKLFFVIWEKYIKYDVYSAKFYKWCVLDYVYYGG